METNLITVLKLFYNFEQYDRESNKVVRNKCTDTKTTQKKTVYDTEQWLRVEGVIKSNKLQCSVLEVRMNVCVNYCVRKMINELVKMKRHEKTERNRDSDRYCT